MPDIPDPAVSKFPIRHGILQGNLDCAGHTLINVDLAGFNLTKASVGLGNVDNTSDLNKPISIATQAALDLKEDLIAAGFPTQFWKGDKTWADYGDFIFQNNETTFALISVKGINALGNSTLQARRNDYDSSLVSTSVSQLGAGFGGNILGLPAANMGLLSFSGVSYGAIMTIGSAAPLVFGVNGIRRMRLTQGLNVGADTDPGAGCIAAMGVITAVNGMVSKSLLLTGEGGQGYIALGSQTVDPPGGLGAIIFSNAVGRIAIASGLNPNNLSFNTALTADRIWTIIDTDGAVPVRVTPVPGGSGATGVSGSMVLDGSFLYICVAANSWRRVAVAAF